MIHVPNFIKFSKLRFNIRFLILNIGTSENAVMIQIWTALITILILKALRAKAKYPWYLSNLVAFIRLNLFVKIELQKWIDNPFEESKPPPDIYKQGSYFENMKKPCCMLVNTLNLH